MSTTQQKKAPLFNHSSRSKLESQILRSSDIESHRSTPLLDQSLISAKRQTSKQKYTRFRGHAMRRVSSESRECIFLARLSLAELETFTLTEIFWQVCLHGKHPGFRFRNLLLCFS